MTTNLSARRDAPPEVAADAAAIVGRAAVVRLVDTEPPWDALLAEWLTDAGLTVAPADAVTSTPDLVVLGMPFPRLRGQRQLDDVRRRWPGVPMLVLSPTFHASVAPGGELARQLGVHGVLALPVLRDALLAAVRQALAA